MQLSKSDYTTYLKHPAWLWIKKHAKTLLPPISPALQAMFDTGNEFEQYAEALFKHGITLGFSDYKEYLSLPARTMEALESGATAIFQGRFEAGELTFICDVIEVVGDMEIDLYEIKSSTSAKPEHNVDLAFQMVVLEQCGFKVRNIAVIHVNNQYVRTGEIQPEKITAVTDVTEDVKELRDFTLAKIEEALSVMNMPECPDTSPTLASPSSFKEWLDIYKHMKKTKPGSIYDLCQLDSATLQNLVNENIEDIKDIPLDFVLKTKQSLQVQAAKNGVNIDLERIQEFLATFVYPLYFLDYETMGSLVPYFDGIKPYQQLPFQYSLHILDSEDAELRHEEFIHTEKANPAYDITESLRSHIGDNGTVIAWNMSFEKGCNDMLAELVPEHAEFLTSVNERMTDLMIPFFKNWYVDAEFKGSASIKNVLPVLVPQLSYKSLNIQEGNSAQRIWMETILNDKNPEQKQQIIADLLEYCGLDTYAMVEIYRQLSKLI